MLFHTLIFICIIISVNACLFPSKSQDPFWSSVLNKGIDIVTLFELLTTRMWVRIVVSLNIHVNLYFYCLFCVHQDGRACTCAALSAIAVKVSQFELEVSLVIEVEKKLALVGATIKQLGYYIQNGGREWMNGEWCLGSDAWWGRMISIHHSL